MHFTSSAALILLFVILMSSGCRSPRDSEGFWNPGETPPTLRIDYLHTGDADSESFRLDDLVVEGPWPGPLDRTIDALRYGPYFFEVTDLASGERLYSRGFASIFEEWQTTGEAHDTSLTFHESLRIPKTDRPVRLVLSKRDSALVLQEVWRVEIDPSVASPVVTNPAYRVWTILDNGAPAEKVDILMLGDGYTSNEMAKWHEDARRLADTLFSYEPFRSLRGDFNVRAVDSPSEVSGISQPSAGLTYETPIGTTYDAFGMERYILTFENERWRNVAAAAPYEFVIIVANNHKYGGAGIYNLFSTVSADNAFTPYVLVHEFGHHFAGLGDEYYTSDVSYELDEARPEPWSPNVTADPIDPKWKDLVDASTPLPTPWPKDAFEQMQKEMQARRTKLRDRRAAEAEIESLFEEERAKTREILDNARFSKTVGAFEGANYASTGYYRPEINCIMFTREEQSFCKVCSLAIGRMVEQYVTREDAATSSDP